MSGVRRVATGLLVVSGLPIVLFIAGGAVTAGSTSFYWPPLSEILGVFPETWFEGRLTSQVLPSLMRLAAGYALALVVGITLGVAIGSSRTLRNLLEPVTADFHRIGGSHAQWELFEETMVACYLALERYDDAARLVRRRLQRRASPRDEGWLSRAVAHP